MRKCMCLAMMTILLLLVGCNQTEMNEITMDTNQIDKNTQAMPHPSEIFLYSDEQLTEIAELADSKDALMKRYPTSHVRSVSIAENDSSNASPSVVVCYRGETKVLQIFFDGSSGCKISSYFYSIFCSRNAFDALEIGQSLTDVQRIDPEGKYYFLYTGRNDVPRVSTHYTTDGFCIRITYDIDNVIEKIMIEPMW